MQLRRWTVEIVALAIVVSSCGRPKLKSLERHQETVEDNALTAKDARGEQQVVLVIHRDDCPGDRTRLTVWAGDHGTADCLRGLAVGAHIEIVHAIYKFQPMSCGGHDLPKSTIGGCSVQGVSFEQIGTACPAPRP